MSSAFVIYFFALMFFSTSIFYILISKFTAEFIIMVNPFISDSTMTIIFVQNFNFVVSVFGAIPLISLISLVIWGFVKIQEEKEAGF